MVNRCIQEPKATNNWEWIDAPNEEFITLSKKILGQEIIWTLYE